MDDLNIQSRDLARLLEQSVPPRLLDIRMPEERAVVHLANSQLVDQALVEDIVQTWPRDTAMVCYCHHGIRSLEAAMYFRAQGFTDVKSLAGGIDAWAIEIDPSLPRY